MRSILALCFLFLAPAGACQLLAGSAKCDITPPDGAGVPLGGYAARRGALSTGVHDHIYARALVLSTAGHTAAIVSADLCFLPDQVVKEARLRILARCPYLHPDEIFLSATHTHSAPDPLAMVSNINTGTLKWPRFDAGLLERTLSGIAHSVELAGAARSQAQLFAAECDGSALNRNRRGGRKKDSRITVLSFRRPDGKSVGTLASFAAHPTLYTAANRQISADWPGVTLHTVEDVTGSVCIYLGGIQGDASAAVTATGSDTERVTTYGEMVAGVVVRALAGAAHVDAGALRVRQELITLPSVAPNGLYLAAAASLGLSISASRALVQSVMPRRTTVTAIRLGRALILGLPCEPTAALGLPMYEEARKSGVRYLSVGALTNGWLGYALTPEEYAAGGYEASMSFYGPGLGRILAAGVRRAMSSTTMVPSAPGS